MSKHVLTNSMSPEERSARNLTAWALLAGLLLFGALAGPFFAGRVYTADDLGAFHLPVRAFYAEQLARGQAPDWMPSLYSGFYLTGEGQAGVYHPLHQILYRFLPLRAALAWECLLSYPLMFLGTWLLLRRRIGRGGAAALGAVLFTFCSFNLLHFVHPNAVAVIAHIPWLLWAIDVVLRDARRRRVALAAALIALLTGSQLLLGYPQYVWLSLLAEGAYAVFLLAAYRYTERVGCHERISCNDCVGCAAQTWPRLVIAWGIGLLLGGVQLLPTLDAWLHSERVSAGGSFAAWGSLHPLNLLQLVAPYMFADRVVGDSTHEYGLYLGAAPFVLLMWMLFRRRELGGLSRLAWSAFGFAVVALLLAFGRYGPLYCVMTWLPVVGTFRFPCRYLILFQLAAAVLAAIGFVLLSRESGIARNNRALRLPSQRPSTTLEFVGQPPSAVLGNPAQPRAAVPQVILGHPPSQRRRPWRGLWRDYEPLWCIVGFSAVVALIGLGFCRQPYMASAPAILAGPVLLAAAAVLVVLAAKGHSAALVGLILFAAADLGFYGMSYSVYAHNDVLQRYVAAARTPPGVPEGRVVADLLRFDAPGLRTGDLMTLRGWERADGYAGLAPRRRLDYRLLPALRVAGVRWVKNDPSTSVVAGLKPYNGRWLQVPDPLPRVRLVSRTRTSSNPATDISAICPDDTALVEVPLALPASKPGKAVLAVDRPGRLAIDVDCPAPQLLVAAESYHPGWRASIDGCPATVYRADGDFLGCLTQPGKHRIIFEFRPESLQRGWMVSCLGLCFVSLCFLGFTVRPESRLPEDCLP